MNQTPVNSETEAREEQILQELQQILWNIKKECYLRRAMHKRYPKNDTRQGTVLLYRDSLH